MQQFETIGVSLGLYDPKQLCKSFTFYDSKKISNLICLYLSAFDSRFPCLYDLHGVAVMPVT